MMTKIKALLIEEIIFVIFLIITGLCTMDYASDGAILFIMKILCICVVIGKAAEAVLDNTVCKNFSKDSRAGRVMRMMSCFVVISVCYFVFLNICFTFTKNSFMLIMFSLMSMILSFFHLFLSSFLDRTLDYYSYDFDDEEDME